MKTIKYNIGIEDFNNKQSLKYVSENNFIF